MNNDLSLQHNATQNHSICITVDIMCNFKNIKLKIDLSERLIPYGINFTNALKHISKNNHHE